MGRSKDLEDLYRRLGPQQKLFTRRDWAVFEVTGKDATSYLHRMLTQDIASLLPMHAAYSCVLTPTGRILGDPLVWNLGDCFLLDMSRAAADKAIPALERTVIADDVTFREVSAEVVRACTLDKRDGAAGEIIAVDVPPDAPDSIRQQLRLSFTAHGLLGCRWDLGARPAQESLWPASLGDLPGLYGPLGQLLTPEEYEVTRVEEGVPAYGAELDERVLPNEANLESAISWTKGCYPGQEPVVMAKHRGHPPTRLVRLAFDGDEVPAHEAPLLDQGKPVGRVTSAVRGVRLPGIVGMGYVRHALAREGASFSLASGAKATVRSLV